MDGKMKEEMKDIILREIGIKKTSVSAVASNDGVMRQVANIAHHGALIGYEDIYEAMAEIRKLTLPWWDQKECESKQVKLKGGA